MKDIKENAAFNSILASAGLAVGKFFAAFTTGSLGLLSDAIHALLDVGATGLTYVAVRISAKPADENHHYGHGKVEAVAALIETGFLFAVAVYVAVEAIGRLRDGSSGLEPSFVAYAILLVAIGVDVFRSRSLLRIAKETNSDALAADALHFGSDLISSGLVLVGLIASSFGFPQADSLAAIGVAIFITIAGYRLGKRTIDTLMDVVPEGLSQTIRDIAENVSGVASVDVVRARGAGQEIFADISIGVARTLSLDHVSTIKAQIITLIKAQYPLASVVVTATPKTLDDETILERVLHTATVLRHPIHHVTIQRVGAMTSVSLDLEVDGRLSLSEGHAIASAVETAIIRELGPDTEVEIHLEPLEVLALEGVELDQKETAQISDTLVRIAKDISEIKDIHEVRVRKTTDGLIVNYHCSIDPEVSIADAHTHVDEFERAVRLEIPEIVRVVGHAEPRTDGGAIL